MDENRQRSMRSAPNDISKVDAGTQMEHLFSGKWCAITIRGVSPDRKRFAYERRSDGHVYSSTRAALRQPSRFRWPTVEGPPIEAAPPMDLADVPEVVAAVPVAVPPAPSVVSRPALPPEPPPIVMNGEGNEVVLGEHRIPLYVFGRGGVILTGHLDGPCDYKPGSIADLIRGEWKKELREGDHYIVLKGADLRRFKAIAHATGTTPVPSKVSQLTVLTEAGIDRVLLLTKKPAGVRLRAYLADHWFPKVRRGEGIPPVGGIPPSAPAAGALDEERIARIVGSMIAAALPGAIQAAVAGAIEILKPMLGIAPGAAGTRRVAVSGPTTQLPLPYSGKRVRHLDEAATVLIPKDWDDRRGFAKLLTGRTGKVVSKEQVSRAIDELHVRGREPAVNRYRPVLKQTKGSVVHEVPHEFFAPSVLEEVAAFLKDGTGAASEVEDDESGTGQST